MIRIIKYIQLITILSTDFELKFTLKTPCAVIHSWTKVQPSNQFIVLSICYDELITILFNANSTLKHLTINSILKVSVLIAR